MEANGVEEHTVNGTEEKSEGNGATIEEQPKEGQAAPEPETFQIFIKKCSQEFKFQGAEENISLQVTPLDNIQDLKQFLFESPDTAHITNYNLFLNDAKLNDFSDLADLTDLKPNSVLEMREAPYDDRTIKFHVRRLRELISAGSSSNSPSLFSQILPQKTEGETKKEESKKEDHEEVKFEASLPDFFPKDAESTELPQCLKSLIFSGWNPPPGNRKLRGDLIYIVATTLEKKSFHITGSSKGFFVNSSTNESFNPNPSAEKPLQSHSLAGLLSQLSSGFKKEFQNVHMINSEKHPFQLYPTPYPTNPWVARAVEHTYNLNRSEEALLFGPDTDMRGQLRDWNEEYQSCRDLPSDTLQEKIYRDRIIVKVNADFVDAATKGAIAIIEKTVPPINPLDPERAHMYIYNNIFFSYAVDGRDFYKEYGGDRAAYMSVNNDLKGIRVVNQAGVRGLYTLATAIIDYRGHRIVAQSIIPGILQREQNSTVIYGSIDNGKKISSDPDFHELLLKVAKRLSIREHKIIDQDGNIAKLCCGVESKGIVGTDGRKYILDLLRVTPRDINYLGREHMLTILRPELVFMYFENLRRLHRLEKEQKKAKEQAEKAKEQGKEGEKEAPKELEESTQNGEVDDDFVFPEFNPNVFCDFKFDDPPEATKQSEDLVASLGEFLIKLIPSLIEECVVFGIPVDGQALTASMHSRGINMRYLGRMAVISERFPMMKRVLLQEMITRAAKHVLRSILRDTEEEKLAENISLFLNCLHTTQENKGRKKDKKKIKKAQIGAPDSITHQSLWDVISWEVFERFGYELPERESLFDILGCVSTLRSICQKVGIQIKAREYHFKEQNVTEPDDILNLFPLVKHAAPETDDGRSLLDAGKSFVSQNRLDVAYELLTEALQIFHQVYGPMHKDTANCYGNLGSVLYHVKDLAQAIDNQQRATIINERVLGLDHPDTCQSYVNLALFYQAAGKQKEALACFKHSLKMLLISSGPSHAEIPTTSTNIAILLQELGQPRKAMVYLLESVKRFEALLGPAHLQNAALYHAIAMAYSQIGEYKEALNYEKKNYNLLQLHKVPEADPRMSESNLWLKQFTTKAVQVETKKLQASVINAGKVDLSPLSKNSQQVVKNVGSSPVPMGARSLDDIMRFINTKGPVSATERSFKERNQTSAQPKANQGPVAHPPAHENGTTKDASSAGKNAPKKPKKKKN